MEDHQEQRKRQQQQQRDEIQITSPWKNSGPQSSMPTPFVMPNSMPLISLHHLYKPFKTQFNTFSNWTTTQTLNSPSGCTSLTQTHPKRAIWRHARHSWNDFRIPTYEPTAKWKPNSNKSLALSPFLPTCASIAVWLLQGPTKTSRPAHTAVANATSILML